VPLVEQDRGQPIEVLAGVGRRRCQIGAIATEVVRRRGDAVDADDLETGAAALERIENVLADQAADAGDRDPCHVLGQRLRGDSTGQPEQAVRALYELAGRRCVPPSSSCR